MTRREFLRTMERYGIPPYAYCLDGGYPSERYCIAPSGKGWKYYYSERGHENDVKLFATEGKALKYLCQVLIETYRTIRRPF